MNAWFSHTRRAYATHVTLVTLSATEEYLVMASASLASLDSLDSERAEPMRFLLDPPMMVILRFPMACTVSNASQPASSQSGAVRRSARTLSWNSSFVRPTVCRRILANWLLAFSACFVSLTPKREGKWHGLVRGAHSRSLHSRSPRTTAHAHAHARGT